MTTRTLLIAATALSLIAMPAVAQTTKTDGGHHYSGGPKSEVPHHMGKKKVTTTGKAKPSGSHHYSGGPREPHHIGPK
jgi:hypothetical protein